MDGSLASPSPSRPRLSRTSSHPPPPGLGHAPARPEAPRPVGSPLAREAFRAVWIAAIFSNIGGWLQDVGESWLMLSLTPSPMLVALVTTSASIPLFLFMLPAGVASDRLDRRRILLGTQSALVVISGALAALTWLHIVSPGLILLASSAMGIASAIGIPAWQTLLPDLVPRREMPEAVTLNSVAFNIARAIGPVLGGMIIAAAGPGAAFGLNAVSFLAVIYVLLRYPDVRRASERGRVRRPIESFGGAMVSAVRHAYGSAPLRALYTSASVFAVSAASVPALLPVLAKETLHTSEAGYGILLGGLGSGAVVGAMVLRRVRDTVRARTIVAGSMALYGLSVTALTLRPSLPIATALLVPAGIGWICSLSSVNALVQLTAPPPLRARALALYQLAFYASWSVGASLGGAMAHHVGIAGTMRLAALGTVVAAAITTLLPLPSFADGARAVEKEAISIR